MTSSFGEILIVDLGFDPREHLVLQNFELEVLHRVFGLRDLAVVFHARGGLLGVLLQDLIDQIVVLGLLVEGDLFLGLPIELDEDVTGLYPRAGRGDLDDDEAATAAATLTAARLALAGEERCRGNVKADGFGKAGEADSADEIVANERLSRRGTKRARSGPRRPASSRARPSPPMRARGAHAAVVSARRRRPEAWLRHWQASPTSSSRHP